jgi:transcriptional regulator
LVYLPPAFTETREEVLIAHIERHDFGLLVSHGDAGLVASQIPFLVDRRDDKLLLQGHVARANPQVADLDCGEEALAIFTGPHAYISPTWYGAGPAVPTWNYASVHAYGAMRSVADRDWLDDLVRRLSERHEAREPTAPWRMAAEPATYLAMMLRGIVGIEITVDRLEGKFKLSQNRPVTDRPRIIAALEHRDDADSHGVARLMREREPTSD